MSILAFLQTIIVAGKAYVAKTSFLYLIVKSSL